MEQRQTILLVEDSRTQAIMLMDTLGNAGWKVCHADSAEKALELLARFTPDLILVDYYLPAIRGDELCRQIRMRMDTRTVPLVILTNDALQEVELRGLESGADDCLSKSAETAVLILRLRSLLAKAAAHAAPLPSAPADAPTPRLLTVDDSRTYLTYLTKQLEEEGYLVDTASSGTEALDRLAAQGYDCALIDLVMPGMDGIELCNRIHATRDAATKSMMVLMLTAKEDNQNLARALEAGADDFVGKSSDIVVIKGRIRALLRRKSYEDEHRRRLIAELAAKELETRHALAEKEAMEARAALVDDLEHTAVALRRSNEELQQFASIASHDLQEPLRAIASYVQFLERRLMNDLDEESREFMGYIVDGVRRMKALICDLLACSKVGTASEAFCPVDCEEALAESLMNLEAAVQESGARVTHDGLPTLPADHAQMIQLFQNLIANAIKYRGEAPPAIHVSVRNEASTWIFSVRDNGIGIAERYWERIFVIFQRLHTRATYPGTGIGLTICKKIVERHGGRIWVESTPGEGSTFYFALPQAEAKRRELTVECLVPAIASGSMGVSSVRNRSLDNARARSPCSPNP